MTLIQADTVGIYTTCEVCEVLLLGWRPCNLSKSQRTRIHLILHLGIGVHILRPVVALNTENMLLQAQ